MKKKYYFFEENDKFGLKDPKNRTILPAIYDDIYFIDKNTPIYILKDDKLGLADIKGNIIVEPMYSQIYLPHNGLIAVEANGKWGFIDYKGRVFVPLIYDDIDDFTKTAKKDFFILNPFGEFFDHLEESWSETRIVISKVFCAALLAIPFFGLLFAGETLMPLPLESFLAIVYVAAIIITIMLPAIMFIKLIHSKHIYLNLNLKGIFNFFRIYVGSILGWAYTFAIIIGSLLFLFFGANKYLGDKYQYTHGIIKNINVSNNEHGKSTNMDIEISELDRSYNTWIPNDHNYHMGYGCSVEYHKGLFGLYVIDEVK